MGKKNYSRIELKLDKQKKYIEKELKKVLAEISAPKILKEVMLGLPLHFLFFKVSQLLISK